MRVLRNVAITFAVWLGIAAFLWLIIPREYLGQYQELSKRAVEGEGIVVEKEFENHHLVRYSYAVGGNKFEGTGRLGAGNKDFESLKVGEVLKIYVDPQHPEVSSLGVPSSLYQNERLSRWAVVILFPLIITAVLLMRGILPSWRM